MLMGMAKPTPWFPPPPPVEDGGVNADQVTTQVDHGAAGVSWIDGGIGLNEILIRFDCAT